MIYEECKATLFNDASSRNNTPKHEAPLCARDWGIIFIMGPEGRGGGGGGSGPPGPVTPNFVLPGNGPADLIRLPEMVRRTKSRCLKWSTGPFQAAQNGPTLPVLVR